MPVSTSWAIRWMLVAVGSCSISTFLSPMWRHGDRKGHGHIIKPSYPPSNVGKAPWYTLPLSAITIVSTGCPGRGTQLVPALQLSSRTLPVNPSPPIPLHYLANVPLAQTLILPDPCPQSLIHSVCNEGDSTLPNQLSQRESSDFY